MTIVLCSKGYPGKYKKNSQIKNLNKVKLSKGDYIYHAEQNISMIKLCQLVVEF